MNEIVLTNEQYTIIGQFHNSTAGHAGIVGQLSECTMRGFPGPTYVSLSEHTFACAQFVRR